MVNMTPPPPPIPLELKLCFLPMAKIQRNLPERGGGNNMKKIEENCVFFVKLQIIPLHTECSKIMANLYCKSIRN